MKIRADYVTNSSSVSYIVTMHKETAERFKKMFYDFDTTQKRSRIYNLLYKDLINEDKKILVNNCELYYKSYQFHKRKDRKYEEDFGENIDFSTMSDQDLWLYIYGEYFVEGNLASELEGFGSIMTPKHTV